MDNVPWTDQSEDRCAQRLVSVPKPAGSACERQAHVVEGCESPKKRVLFSQAEKVRSEAGFRVAKDP